MRWSSVVSIAVTCSMMASAPVMADDGPVPETDVNRRPKPKPKPKPHVHTKPAPKPHTVVVKPNPRPKVVVHHGHHARTQDRRHTVRVHVKPVGAVRPFVPTPGVVLVPPHRRADHRYARPALHVVRAHPLAPHPVPVQVGYRARYHHWWVHPYFRHHHSTTLVVGLPFAPTPYVAAWKPPQVRTGFTWVDGHRDVFGVWHPGHWRPVAAAPVRQTAKYVFVEGHWSNSVYVDGYYRIENRGDDWRWVDGYYLEDGTFIRGRWEPAGAPPQGMTWEAGLFDGETWVEGFWRPEFRSDYVWISAFFDSDGIFHGGYWEPVDDKPGLVWVPGWFDGAEWQKGSWVGEAEYRDADVDHWQPEEGWNEGWEGAAPEAPNEIPLALPVNG